MRQINFRKSKSNIKPIKNDKVVHKKMLHEYIRKEQSRIVQQQNKFNKKRIENQKSTIDRKQL